MVIGLVVSRDECGHQKGSQRKQCSNYQDGAGDALLASSGDDAGEAHLHGVGGREGEERRVRREGEEGW